MRIYNNNDELINEMKDQWNKDVRSTRMWGIVAAIFMILIGILCFVYPLETTYTIEVMASIALLAGGIWQMVRYFQRPVFLRTGISLLNGILNVIVAIMLLTSPAEDMLVSFGFLFGLELMTLGFEQIGLTSRLHVIGVAETGWVTLNAVLNIIAGIILLFMPMASIGAVSLIFAIYFLFGGIFLLITSIKSKDLEA